MGYDNIIESLLNKQFARAEELSVRALAKDHFNAQLWLYLAEALCFQGYGASAMAVFNRAWILDPDAMWIAQAAEDLKKSNIGRFREETDKLLAVESISVTAALIVKNESEHIENCLRRIVNAVDEIVIVDTGSTDDTIEIIKNFPKIKIINFEWCDDFAAARNAAMPHIKSDWVIWIDADEYLYEEDVEAIKEVAAMFRDVKAPVLIRIGIMCQNDDGSIFGKYYIPRMFRMKDNFIFSGRVHEQLIIVGKDMYYNQNVYSKAVRIRLLHHGYKLSILEERNKLDRNIRLLKKMVDENPYDPAWLFFLGRELFHDGQFDESMEVLSKCERESFHYPGFGRLLGLYTMMAKMLVDKSDYDAAEEVCKKALLLRNDFPDILYLLAVISVEKGRDLYKAAKECAIKSKARFEGYRDIISPDYSILNWKADILLADVALNQGSTGEAYSAYQKLLKSYPAREDIREKIGLILREQGKLTGYDLKQKISLLEKSI